MPRVKKVTKKSAELVKISLKVLTQTFTSEGETLKEALLKIKPGNFKGRTILTVEKGAYKRDRLVNPRLMFQIYGASNLMREIGLKQISILFGV